MRPGGLSQWKIPVTPSEIDLSTFRFVARCLNRLCHACLIEDTMIRICAEFHRLCALSFPTFTSYKIIVCVKDSATEEESNSLRLKSQGVGTNSVNRLLLHPDVCNETFMWNVQWIRISVNVMVFIFMYFCCLDIWGSIPAAAGSKAWVCGRLLAGIAGSNPAWAWMYYDCCVLSGGGLCVGLIIRQEDSYRVWRVWVWSCSLDKKYILAH